MFNSFVKIGVVTLIIGALGCSEANNKPVSIGFTPDSAAFVVKGVNPVGIQALQHQLQQDSLRMELVWVSVDEKSFPGRVELKDEAVYFYPEQALQKGKSYRVSTLLNSNFGAPGQVLKGEVSYKVRPQQQVLVR